MGCGTSVLKDSYQKIDGTRFADVLKRGCVAVVKGAYFKQCLERGEPFQDRKQIPEEFIFSGKEVIKKWKKHGNIFLIIISYGWLSRRHPDPELYHLKHLVHVLNKFQEHTKMKEDVGVILDFCSLWQNRSTVENEDSRTVEEKAEFDDGLTCINTPYAHQEVTAIKLMQTPPEEKRRYDDRGWTLFESKLIDGKATGAIDGWGLLNVLVLAKEIDTNHTFSFILKLRRGRDPPMSPARFELQLEVRQKRADEKGVKLFTSGRDQPFIIKKYQSSYAELAKATELSFTTSDWTDEHVKELVKCLPDFLQLKKVDLMDNEIGNEGAIAIGKAMETNKSITKLNLGDNEIGDEGAIALAKALDTNKSITELDMFINRIGNDGAIALAKAMETNKSITTLDLRGQDIGDAGFSALDEAKDAHKKRWKRFVYKM